ncbi:MAG: hypothetical protein KDC08_08565 [Actinobacteria bacterium]|nr:hypothetical protein [Actinomycetota bacterium]
MSATAGTLAAVGIANAVSTPQKIPDSRSGVITACVAKKGGAVRFIDAQKGKKCGMKQQTVRFNQAGPQGPAGIQGPQGERGPSEGFVRRNTTDVAISSTQTPAQNTVVSMDLPAGNYSLSGAAELLHGVVVQGYMVCSLRSSAGTVTSTETYFTPTPADYNTATVSGMFSTDVPATISVSCNPQSPIIETSQSKEATIQAVRLASVS